MKFIVFLLAALFLAACSEDSVYFEPTDAETVSVQAYLTHLGDSSKNRLKTDTLLPSDSVIFLAIIEPSRSIRIHQFYWQIDSGEIRSEFSYRTNIPEPGKHIARFLLLDRFSDTLTDSVIFWTAPQPVLHTTRIVPQNNSQNLPFDSAISFAWNFTNENPLATTYYSFRLECGNQLFADTLLKSAQFIWQKKLPPLERCVWQVSARDDFGMDANDTIRAAFWTADSVNSQTGSAFFSLNLPLPEIGDSISFTLWDSTHSEISNFTVQKSQNQFCLQNLEPGPYRIFFKNPIYADYTSDTIPFSIQAQKITQIDNISIRDTVSPILLCEKCMNDSLSFADTLLFFFVESGFHIPSENIDVAIDGTPYETWELKNDTLRLFTAELSPSFIWHPLTISAKDRAGNFSQNDLYISPDRSCVQSLGDTLIEKDSSIVIPIANRCPHLQPKRFFWDIDEDGSWDGEASAESDFAQKKFSGTLFKKPANRIRVVILYESGARFENAFTLYVNGISG